MTRITRSAVRRDIAGKAVVQAAKDSLVRYGYYEHRQVLKDAKVFVNMDTIPWDVVMGCVLQDLKLKLVKVNADFFKDYVLNVDHKAVKPIDDAKIDPSRYLAGTRRPTAGCISAEINKWGEVIWAKVQFRQKVEQGIRRGTDEYTAAIKRAKELLPDAPGP